MSDFPATVEILGAQHVTSLPSFGVREALVLAAAKHSEDEDMRVMWILAAAVGACSGIGARAGTSLQRCGYDVLRYGERVYSYLREQGAAIEDVGRAGNAVLSGLSDSLMPGDEEVKEAVGFSEGQAGRAS